MNVHRAVSTRLPLGLLLRLSRLDRPDRRPEAAADGQPASARRAHGVALHLLTIGVSMHPDPEVRVCDTLDWYAPRYLSRHTREEVAGWFAEAGLTEIVDLSERRFSSTRARATASTWRAGGRQGCFLFPGRARLCHVTACRSVEPAMTHRSASRCVFTTPPATCLPLPGG